MRRSASARPAGETQPGSDLPLRQRAAARELAACPADAAPSVRRSALPQIPYLAGKQSRPQRRLQQPLRRSPSSAQPIRKNQVLLQIVLVHVSEVWCAVRDLYVQP